MRILLPLLIFLGMALAQTPAGTLIQNQASAVVGGEVYLSNLVETVVQAICQPAISPNGSIAAPGQKAIVLEGGYAYFNYLLNNSGNLRSTYQLSAVVEQGDWNPRSATLFIDSNQNFQRDSGEGSVAQITLDPGQQVRLVMEVASSTGDKGVAYISPVATCADGTRDANNTAQVSIGKGASLSISKTVSLSQAAEGQELVYTVYVSNQGNQTQDGPVYVEDNFSTPQMAGLSYVQNSASAPKGTLEYSAGGLWQTDESKLSQVQSIRLVLNQLIAGETVGFSFRMRVQQGALAGSRSNTATVQAGLFSAQATADVSVVPRFAHALGPINLPTAQGQADGQSAKVPLGQDYCFAQSLLNTGNSPDQYTLSIANLPSGVKVDYYSAQGPLSQPLVLQPGEHIDFRVCLSNLPQDRTSFTFVLQATSATNQTSDPTTNTVNIAFVASDLRLQKTVDLSVATPNERLVYTLEATNPLPFALNNAVVEDVLDNRLEFVSASDGGTYDPQTRTVRWTVASLGSAQSLRLTLTTKVVASAEEGTVSNMFVLRSDEFPEGATSPTVQTTLLPTSILLSKEVAPIQATYGDLVTYKVTIKNTGKVPLNVRLVDTPDVGMMYAKGTARKGSEALEPTLSGASLVWESVRLAPEETVVITYQMRILVGAPDNMRNNIEATGNSANGSKVAAAAAAATLKLNPGVFAPPNILAGRVYLDTNRDGKYQYGLDIPLPGARVVLSNGLQVLTDAEGRYTFRNLAGGIWETYLDPTSAPFEPLPHPEHLGDGYRHRTRVLGLTESDFPLARPLGQIGVVRETRLEFGPLVITKKIIVMPSGIRVVLSLHTSEALNEFVLTDPLPTEGAKEFKFDTLEGDKTLTYDLPALRLGSALTDPQVRWRYP